VAAGFHERKGLSICKRLVTHSSLERARVRPPIREEIGSHQQHEEEERERGMRGVPGQEMGSRRPEEIERESRVGPFLHRRKASGQDGDGAEYL